MRNVKGPEIKSVEDLIGPLARVRPGRPGGEVSGTGARTLLASVTAEEPTGRTAGDVPVPAAVRRYGLRRLTLGAAAVVLAAGFVVGPSLLEDGSGGAASYANSAVAIEREGGDYVARIKDPFAEREEFGEAFAALGLKVGLNLSPASPGAVGEIFRVGTSGGGVGRGFVAGTEPSGCSPSEPGCVMVLRVPADFTGEAWIELGRQARPGEAYRNHGSAVGRYGELRGTDVDGRPVEEVLAEVRRRGLQVEFQRIIVGDGGSLSFEAVTAGEVGPAWTVWDAEAAMAGKVRLMVTPEKLDDNPMYEPGLGPGGLDDLGESDEPGKSGEPGRSGGG
ncbi:hypothetical protein ACFFMN_34615 [Planobispora siamensis]|uniref:Uncharacterized protein n=1 Tax=Planobispora siamensis TaxID=936338 RepID=A0A8J3SBW0_9ACTN|nr:hypothetical protein [Planobispora siamensis]GIH91811.1 hypothetical protein Psi01_24410 [Planobispora siamensis]